MDIKTLFGNVKCKCYEFGGMDRQKKSRPKQNARSGNEVTCMHVKNSHKSEQKAAVK